jgi:hypothetical protein
MELSRREFCLETGSFGLQTVSSSAFVERRDDGTIIRLDLAPNGGPNAGCGAPSLGGAKWR